MTLLREIGDTAGTAESLIDLAWILATQGDNVKATRLYFESFSILQGIQDNEFAPSCLEGLAAGQADLGEATWAARLLGKAEEWRKRIGTPSPAVYRARYEQTVAARAGLGEEDFETAWAEGQAIKLEEVLLAPNTQVTSQQLTHLPGVCARVRSKPQAVRGGLRRHVAKNLEHVVNIALLRLLPRNVLLHE